MCEFEHRQGESAKVAGSQYTKKRKKQTEVNSTSSFKVKKIKWNGTTVYPSDEISNGENHLALTQKWRKLLFNNVSKNNEAILLRSDRFFRVAVNVLLYGIDKCAGNPAQWSREDTYTFYNKILSFFECWKVRLLRKNKREWVADDTNQVNILTSVYQEALKFITFSAPQKKKIDSKFKEINDLKNAFPSMETLLKIDDQELSEAKKQADDNAEKLERSSFKTLPTSNPSTQVCPLVMLGCLQDKEKQLNDLKNAFPSMETLLNVKDQEISEAKEQADDNAENLKRNSFKSLPTSNPSTQVYRLVMLDGCLQDKEKQPNDLKNTFPSMEKQLKMIKDQERSEAKKQADGHAENLKRNSFKLLPTSNLSTQVYRLVMLDGCLQNKEKQLNELKKTFPSMETPLNVKDQERSEAKKQADGCAEKLKRSSFKTLPTSNPSTQVCPLVMLDGCLQNKEKQLNDLKNTFPSMETPLKKVKDQKLSEAKKQADGSAEKFKRNSFKTLPTSNPSTQVCPLVMLDGCLQDQEKPLNDLKNTFPSMETPLNVKDQERSEAKKQADGSAEKFKRSSFKTLPTSNPSTQVCPLGMLDGCLQDKEKQLNDVKNTFPSMETLLKVKDQELSEAKNHADGNTEKLKRSSFETMPTSNPLVMLDGSRQGHGLQDKQKQLNELKQQLDWGAKKQKETEAELRETREQLQSFVVKSREMTQTKQKDTIKKLSEIQTLLSMTNPNYRPSCHIENETLNKEEKIFQDIKALIECTMEPVKSDNNCEKNSTKSALETNSSSASLRVSEYEMHLVTQIAAFLKITPFPVSSQTIYSYVANIDNSLDLQFVENLLKKFPSFFKEVAGDPGSMDKKWIYLDLKPVITI